MASIIDFPRSRIRKPKPDTVEVQYDFNSWTLAYYSGDRFRSRLVHSSQEEAEAEAQRLSEGVGFIWRFGRNGLGYIMPDETDGGCWSVAHRSKSDDSDAILGRHLSIDTAIPHAIRAARELKAECNLNSQPGDHGGAA